MLTIFIFYYYFLLNIYIVESFNILNYWYTFLYYFNYLDKNYLIFITILIPWYFDYRLNFFIFLNSIDKSGLIYYNLYMWPTTLIYGFNLIHPLMFYISLIATGLYFNRLQLCKIKFTGIYISGTIALLLGMYWGSINEVWGFFWTYDQVEITLLTLLLVLFYYKHSSKFVINSWIYVYLYICLIVYILLLRYNIIFTVHSFFISTKLYFLVQLQLILLLLYYYNKKNIKYSWLFTFYYIYAYTYILYFTLPTIFTILKKKMWFLHCFFFYLITILLLPTYYYNILTTQVYIIFNNYYTSTNLINTAIFLFNEVLTTYTLYYTSYFYYLYSQVFFYTYIYYFGYFYYFLLISFWRFIVI